MDHLLLPVTLILAFLAAVAAADGLGNLFLSSRAREQRVKRRLALAEAPNRPRAEAVLLKPQDSNAANARIRQALNAVLRYLRQADLSISPMLLAIYTVAGGVALWVVAMLGGGAVGAVLTPQSGVMSLIGALSLSAASVWVYVSGRRNKRLRLLEEQLPVALDIVIRAIRAGHPVISAVQLVTQEVGDPIAGEFAAIVDETTYGVEFREALANFARRTGSDDAHFFAVSVAIQSETGGNLSEILANLAAVVRGRITLSKRIKALSSEGRMSATLLSILPVFLIGFMCITQPAFYISKFSDPIFWPVVVFVVVLYGVGQVIMHRIVNFKY